MARREEPAQMPFFGGELSEDAFESLEFIRFVKAADRFHNHSTMGNAFSIQKQLSYLIETEALVLPMIKAAQRAFPIQEGAFENAKLALKSQISLVRPALELAEKLANAHTAATESRPASKP